MVHWKTPLSIVIAVSYTHLCCPYVVYGKFDDYQKAVILTLGDKEEYVIAKALYYVCLLYTSRCV